MTPLEKPDQYVHFAKLNDVQGVHPQGYIIQFPFYVQAPKMAHVIFSSVEHPTEHHDAYEIVLGASENSRVILRKRMNGAVLGDVYWPNMLSEYKRTKFVFQVRNDGLIQLFSEYDIYNPLVTVFDPVPIKVEYVSAKNRFPEKMIFNYGDLVPKQPAEIEKIKKELVLHEYNTLEINPLWTHYQFKEFADLTKNGKYYESLEDVYKKELPIGEMYKPPGHSLLYSVYTLGIGVVKFRLSPVEYPNGGKDIYYEVGE